MRTIETLRVIEDANMAKYATDEQICTLTDLYNACGRDAEQMADDIRNGYLSVSAYKKQDVLWYFDGENPSAEFVVGADGHKFSDNELVEFDIEFNC